jgi:hypothetical protein
MSAFNDFDARMQESRKRLPPQDASVRAVCDFAQELRACALGQASASILARHILGATPDELRALRETMRRMLKENGPRAGGRILRRWSRFVTTRRVTPRRCCPSTRSLAPSSTRSKAPSLVRSLRDQLTPPRRAPRSARSCLRKRRVRGREGASRSRRRTESPSRSA